LRGWESRGARQAEDCPGGAPRRPLARRPLTTTRDFSLVFGCLVLCRRTTPPPPCIPALSTALRHFLLVAMKADGDRKVGSAVRCLDRLKPAPTSEPVHLVSNPSCTVAVNRSVNRATTCNRGQIRRRNSVAYAFHLSFEA